MCCARGLELRGHGHHRCRGAYAERIAHLVFLDASVPRDGESLSSMIGPQDWNEVVLEWARTAGDGDE